ncbi:MAG: polysaccharide deacetylase family protein [Sulfurimonas sp.]|nr:polysaccharide deacetylase family protein [Sulfurimonas sp.]
MFHRVVEHVKIPGIEISNMMFNQIIQYLEENNYKIISLDQMHKNLLEKRFEKGVKYIVLTFDDGYKDNYNIVFPYLQSKNIPFSIYITTDFIDKKSVLWWYLLEYLLENSNEISFSIENVEFHFSCIDREEKNITYKKVVQLIRKLDSVAREVLFNELFIENNVPLDKYLNEYTLNWDDVIEMSKSDLVTICAHTVSHASLARLSVYDVVKEVENSQKMLEERIGKKVLHFAYPYGFKQDAWDREYKILNQFDFKTSVTTIEDNIKYKNADKCSSLPRIPINGNIHSINEFKIRISGLYSLKSIFKR